MPSLHSNENPCTEKCRKRLRSFLRNFIIPTSLPLPLHKELPNDMRGVILVAVALIAAVTFQAGVTPPGGVWQDSDDGHVPGRAVFASQSVPFYFFLICNTMAFSSSIYLLLYLTFGKPFFLEVLVATLSMCGTYAAAVFSITPYETTPFRLIALVAALPLTLRLAIYLLCWMISKSCYDKESDDKESSSGSCPICQRCKKHAKGSSNDVCRPDTLHQSA
ncbi:uncharacterized protein LOC132167695 isoform X2 [Corylus avellana]|uniref:uncharacterized protein LOC132167695 isoform X2 n=1 Tax=Corylus avellana TaxID=13451 RepID=UPI00286D28E1|nr:uncharacterized protein LOC132167695 isoform X2 [Corylus avellana]